MRKSYDTVQLTGYFRRKDVTDGTLICVPGCSCLAFLAKQLVRLSRPPF